MILSGRNDAPARGHGHSDTAAPHPTPATKRLSGACSPLVRNTRGRVVLNSLQSVWKTPAGLHEHRGDASCGSGQSQPRGGLSFSHIPWDSVISGVRLGPTLGEKRKFLPPTSRNNPKFEELQKVLMDWINAELLPEHIVVRSLEEDIFDGLILHHLFQKLSGLKLDVEEIALTAASQRRKLTAVLESVGQSLQVEEPQAKWSVESIFSKDLLATLHLLVALAKRFQPDLPLPTNVQVEVITMERTKSGLKSEKSVEQLTECGTDKDQPSKDVFDELFKLAPEKVNAVKEAIVKFVNQELDRLGLSVQNLDTQFADGVILLLLIGQLEGFFLHLKEFYLTPSSPAEMLHNVTLALELLKEEGLLSYPVNPEDIVNKDAKSTLRVLYSLFRKHKLKESTDGVPQRSPN